MLQCTLISQGVKTLKFPPANIFFLKLEVLLFYTMCHFLQRCVAPVRPENRTVFLGGRYIEYCGIDVPVDYCDNTITTTKVSELCILRLRGVLLGSLLLYL